MADLTHLSHQFNQKKATCRVIIETPKGCRNRSARLRSKFIAECLLHLTALNIEQILSHRLQPVAT